MSVQRGQSRYQSGSFSNEGTSEWYNQEYTSSQRGSKSYQGGFTTNQGGSNSHNSWNRSINFQSSLQNHSQGSSTECQISYFGFQISSNGCQGSSRSNQRSSFGYQGNSVRSGGLQGNSDRGHRNLTAFQGCNQHASSSIYQGWSQSKPRRSQIRQATEMLKRENQYLERKNDAADEEIRFWLGGIKRVKKE
jgi:hypothetical protein